MSKFIDDYIKRLKWLELCRKCGMNPDTEELYV